MPVQESICLITGTNSGLHKRLTRQISSISRGSIRTNVVQAKERISARVMQFFLKNMLCVSVSVIDD